MQRAISHRVANFLAERSQWVSLTLNSGVVIWGTLASLWLLPIHLAMGQSRTFNGVQVSQKFDPNSEMAKLIKQSTTKPNRSSVGVTVRLGQWVTMPGSKDSYYTYETKEIFKLEAKTYSIKFLADTTSDNPKSVFEKSDGVKNYANRLTMIRIMAR
ncbi:MAG: hypothetical protein QXL01_07290 [Thermoplasmatales archaeon]